MTLQYISRWNKRAVAPSAADEQASVPCETAYQLCTGLMSGPPHLLPR